MMLSKLSGVLLPCGYGARFKERCGANAVLENGRSLAQLTASNIVEVLMCHETRPGAQKSDMAYARDAIERIERIGQ